MHSPHLGIIARSSSTSYCLIHFPLFLSYFLLPISDVFLFDGYVSLGVSKWRLRTHQDILLPENPEDVPQWLDLDLEHVRSGIKVGNMFLRGGKSWWVDVCVYIYTHVFLLILYYGRLNQSRAAGADHFLVFLWVFVSIRRTPDKTESIVTVDMKYTV